MRAVEFITESQGGIFRRAQEVSQGAEVRFKNAETNQEILLVAADMVPPKGAYETEEQLDQGLQQYLKNAIGPDFMQKTQFTGNPKQARAGLVSIWKDAETEDLIAFIKLVKKPGEGAAPVMQSNADFKKQFGYGAGDKTAQRQTLKLKPKDVLKSDSWLDTRSVIGSLQQTIGQRSDLDETLQKGLVQLVDNVARGVSQPVPGMATYATSLEVDYGEVPAPVALITGNFVSGDYLKAEEGLLAPLGLKWSSLSKILYPEAGGEKIYDSYIQLEGSNKLKVSSKDKKGGAAASITGLVDEINKNPERFQDITSNKKFQSLLQVLKIIAHAPATYQGTETRSSKGINGPLILGVDTFKFITAEEAKIIVNSMTSANNRMNPDDALKNSIITPNLHKLVAVKGAKYQDPAYNLGFHLMACVAKNISNIVNQDPNTDALFRAILQRSDMVQVKTTVKSTNDGAAFTDFKVIYPPIFEGKMVMVADNNYMATRKPIAPLSFAIK
jgi:hypothetical protein